MPSIRQAILSWRASVVSRCRRAHDPVRWNGKLALGRLSPEGMQIQAEAQIVEGPSWTVPTLVGTKLFVRDQQSIRALDLGISGSG